MSVRGSDAALSARLESFEERLRRAERGEVGSREISTEALLLRTRTGDSYRIVAHEMGLLGYNLSTDDGPLYIPVDAPAPVLLAGDSIAAGVPYNDGVPWSAELLLPGVTNIALGSQGYFVKPTRPTFLDTILGADPAAQTVIISGGTNDIGQFVTEGKTADQIVELMAARIIGNLAVLHANGLRTYLTTIWPVGNPDTFVGFLVDPGILPASRVAIQAVNEWLRQEQSVRLIDLDPVVANADGWMKEEYDWIDHVHPDRSSDLPVAEAVDAALGMKPIA